MGKRNNTLIQSASRRISAPLSPYQTFPGKPGQQSAMMKSGVTVPTRSSPAIWSFCQKAYNSAEVIPRGSLQAYSVVTIKARDEPEPGVQRQRYRLGIVFLRGLYFLKWIRRQLWCCITKFGTTMECYLRGEFYLLWPQIYYEYVGDLPKAAFPNETH